MDITCVNVSLLQDCETYSWSLLDFGFAPLWPQIPSRLVTHRAIPPHSQSRILLLCCHAPSIERAATRMVIRAMTMVRGVRRVCKIKNWSATSRMTNVVGFKHNKACLLYCHLLMNHSVSIEALIDPFRSWCLAIRHMAHGVYSSIFQLKMRAPS
jgi:hypothetical protein